MMHASSRAGRDSERRLLCMTGAGTRRRWWWLQGRVIAGDPLVLGGAQGRLR